MTRRTWKPRRPRARAPKVQPDLARRLAGLDPIPGSVADPGQLGPALPTTRRDPVDVFDGRVLCAVCIRAARGFGYRHPPRGAEHPCHPFCSRRCQIIGAARAKETNGMIDKTACETQALREARPHFAEALTALGLMAPFLDRSAAEIDQLIEAAVTGYTESLQRQAEQRRRPGMTYDDPIPY